MRTFLLKVLFWICWLIIVALLMAIFLWILSVNLKDEGATIKAIILGAVPPPIIIIITYYVIAIPLYDRWFE